jgi:DNA-binding beta-propeller fold protein YncE
MLTVKREAGRELSIRPSDANVFVANETEVDLGVRGELVDAQHAVPHLAVSPDMVLGDGTQGTGEKQLSRPVCLAFVPGRDDWLASTQNGSNRVLIHDTRTGQLICKFGEKGEREGQFRLPRGISFTSDGGLAFIAEYGNNRVQVLRLVVNRSSEGLLVHLEFVRFIGFGMGQAEGKLKFPVDTALLPNKEIGETLLVSEEGNDRVSQFTIEGAFLRMFAGSGKSGRGKGEFDVPEGITVLAPTLNVAVADADNHRVQIFDSEGNYITQCGEYGKTQDGRFDTALGVSSDAQGNLLVTDDYTHRVQVFNSQGRHICTRNDLGPCSGGIAWSLNGRIALVMGEHHRIHVWRMPPKLAAVGTAIAASTMPITAAAAAGMAAAAAGMPSSLLKLV